MRPSPLRHPVAILRTTIGLTQKELADLVGRAARTIQSIELGHLTLGEELALRIAHETGVDESWLLQGDPTVPPRLGATLLAFAYTDRPYTREDFERQRALNEAAAASPAELAAVIQQGPKPGEDSLALSVSQTKAVIVAARPVMLESLDERLLAAMSHFFTTTRSTPDALLVRWKLRRLLETLASERAIALPAMDLRPNAVPAVPRVGRAKKKSNRAKRKSK